MKTSSLGAWVSAFAGLLLTTWMFYPGYMSFDSAYQWYMVRTGEWVDVHPPLMMLVWNLTERVLPGPGGMLILHLVLYWIGLAYLSAILYRDVWRQGLFVAAVGFWPALLAILPFIWKDVGLLVAMIWTVAFLARDQDRPSRKVRLLALLSLSLACAYRHNALPLALPLVWHLAGREWPGITVPRRGCFVTGIMVIVVLLSQAPGFLPNVERRDTWLVTAAWDIAAISIDTQHVLLPAEIIEPSLTVDELEQHFVGYSNVPIFETGKIKDSVSFPFSDEERKATTRAYLHLWIDHPITMLKHRARLGAFLFGLDPGSLPDQLVFHPVITSYRDNPSTELREPWLQRQWANVTMALVNTPVFAFWFYAGLSSIALMLIRKTHSMESFRALANVLLWSAAFYVLPLFIVAPSAEYRYLAWPVFASLLVIVVATLSSFRPHNK